MLLNHFKGSFDRVEAHNSGCIHEGVDIKYDSACKMVKEIESSLSKHLKEQRKLLGDTSINYVTVGGIPTGGTRVCEEIFLRIMNYVRSEKASSCSGLQVLRIF